MANVYKNGSPDPKIIINQMERKTERYNFTMKKQITLFFVLILLMACGLLPQGGATETTEPAAPTETLPAGDVPTDVPTDAPTPEPADTPTLVPQTGLVSGSVCYPSEFIPEMTAYFLEVDTQLYTELPIAENQSSYQVELAAGTYLAFAWRGEYGLGGGYTAAVPCGFGEACIDHSLLPVVVEANGTTGDVNLCDWVLQGLPVPPGADFPASESVPQLAGITYNNPSGLWHLDGQGQPAFLIGQPDARLSPDGSFVVYFRNDDLWLAPLDGSPARNLTNTPDRVEGISRWWYIGDGWVLFPSYPTDMELGPGITGFLTVVNTDGSGYRVLDPEHDAWNFAVSPDGARVAYGLGQTGFIYDLNTDTSTAFDPAEYGVQGVGAVGSPSWSPDGGRLSWIVGYQDNPGDPTTFGVAVFFLNDKTHVLLHPHQLPGMDGYPPPAVWSPDGAWLAAQVFDADFERAGLWVLGLDGTEIYLGGFNPVWSPDGSRLLYIGQGGVYGLVAAGTWETIPLDLSQKDWFVVDWR